MGPTRGRRWKWREMMGMGCWLGASGVLRRGVRGGDRRASCSGDTVGCVLEALGGCAGEEGRGLVGKGGERG